MREVSREGRSADAAHLTGGQRAWRYQSVRFPLAAYLPLTVITTLSATAWSRAARHAPGFPGGALLATGALTALAFFLALRVLDEHKDEAIDRRYRPELPVPQGLVTLGELRRVGAGLLGLALVANAILAPVLLWPMLAVCVWTALMTREFFAPVWLRSHLTVYLLSHMVVMPLIIGYMTAIDWLVAGAPPPSALGWFLAAAFLNGLVFELGRKIRAPEDEREGVDTYTGTWGVRWAVAVWLLAVVSTALAALGAGVPTGAGGGAKVVLGVGIGLTLVPAVSFLRRPARVWAKRIEATSGLWTLVLYLLLGAGPYVARWAGLAP